MSKYESISFFSDEITIKPHTASNKESINQPVSIRQFVGPGMKARLYRNNETGDYLIEQVKMLGPMSFIEGPEV